MLNFCEFDSWNRCIAHGSYASDPSSACFTSNAAHLETRWRWNFVSSGAQLPPDFPVSFSCELSRSSRSQESLAFDRAQRLSDTFITRQTQLLHLIIPVVHFSSLWTFSDRSLRSMMKGKASDSTLELLSSLPRPPYGWLWLDVTYCFGEIDGNQTPSWALRNLLATRWLVAWVGARVRPWLRG